MIVSNYLSIWEVAHRWHGIDPNKTDPSDLPLIVQDRLRILCFAVLNGDLALYVHDAVPAGHGYGEEPRYELRAFYAKEIPSAVHQCAFSRKYDKPALDECAISRHGLFEHSIHRDDEFPAFWEDGKLTKDFGGTFAEATTDEKKLPRPNSSLFDQSLCQAIARTLWDIYPNMTIKAMTEHPAILKYGNGKIYTGKNTLRDWLSPVAPEHVKKPGRPKTPKPNNDVA
jgi:hypothetical protein